MQPTLPQQFFSVAREHPDKNFLVAKKDNQWPGISYNQVAQYIKLFAQGLLELGLKKGDRVAILAANRPAWVIVDLGTMTAGGISVPIHTTLSPEKIKYILKDSGARFLFIAGQGNIDKTLAIKSQPRTLKKIILMGCESKVSEIVTFGQIIELGKKSQKKLEIPADSKEVASLVYTSGTTGEPKGVMLSHQNFLSNVTSALKAVPITSKDSFLSFLPLSHVLERTAGYYIPMSVGATIYYVENVKKLSDNLKAVKPTVLICVPRIFERVYEKIIDKVQQQGGFKKKLFFFCLEAQSKMHHARREGRPIGWWSRKKAQILDRLVSKKVRKNLGGNLRFAVSGGAALDLKIARFFEDLGLKIIEGYGLTETAPILTVNQLENYEFGTVGLPLDGVELKISPEKEIVVKGDNIMLGYWKKPQETGFVLNREGWFRTGDLGFVDSRGFLTIIGRRKEIIVTSNGKNIPPEPIENALQLSKYISQALLIGNNRQFVTALIVPDFEKLKPHIEGDIRESRLKWPEEIIKLQSIQSLFKHEIETQLSDFADYEKPKKFTLIPHEFTQEAEELTPTLKLRRPVIMAKYKKEIEAMYK